MGMLNPSKTKKPAVKNKTAVGPPKSSKFKKINSDVLNDFVKDNVSEEVYSKLLKIDQCNVFYDCFRINVWTIHTDPERVIPSFHIAESFMLELTDSGDVIDVTIRGHKISA